MRLESSRLYLRNYQLGDFDRVHTYAAEPSFSQFEAWGPNSEDDTREFLRRMTEQAARPDRYEFDFAICLREGDLLIGGCGIRRESPSSAIANLGWAIHPDFQSKGYATEAAQELLRFGFEELGLRIIYATCDARNIPSSRVMEKLGMRNAGLLTRHKLQKGVMRDALRYELAR